MPTLPPIALPLFPINPREHALLREFNPRKVTMPKRALNPSNPFEYRLPYLPEDVERVYFALRIEHEKRRASYFRLIGTSRKSTIGQVHRYHQGCAGAHEITRQDKDAFAGDIGSVGRFVLLFVLRVDNDQASIVTRRGASAGVRHSQHRGA